MAQNAPNTQGIVYLDSIGMMIYTSTLPSVLQFSFPKDIVSDMEVIDEDKLTNFIVAIFRQNANVLFPFNGILLISSNLIFEKGFVSPVTPQTQQEVDGFLDSVPFEQTATIIVEGQNSKVLASNKHFINSFIHSFEDNGSRISLVLPAYFLELDPNRILGINQGILDSVLRKSTTLRQFSFLTPVSEKSKSSTFTPVEKNKEATANDQVDIKTKDDDGKKRLYLLVAVFVGLLIILGIVAVTML